MSDASGTYRLFPWQIEVLRRIMSSEATKGQVLIVSHGRRCGRRCGRSAMEHAMQEAQTKFNAMLEMPTGTLNVKPQPYYRRDKHGKPVRW